MLARQSSERQPGGSGAGDSSDIGSGVHLRAIDSKLAAGSGRCESTIRCQPRPFYDAVSLRTQLLHVRAGTIPLPRGLPRSGYLATPGDPTLAKAKPNRKSRQRQMHGSRRNRGGRLNGNDEVACRGIGSGYLGRTEAGAGGAEHCGHCERWSARLRGGRTHQHWLQVAQTTWVGR
jgi:hypothetical protein